MWTVDIVRGRYLEAAETERYLPRPRVGTGAGFWPLHRYTAEDRDGWDDAARADNADGWARDRKLTREAISRHDECLSWSIGMLKTEHHRHVVWKWAFCQANGWSFSEACRRRGWVRVTAYRRLSASFELITAKLLGGGTMPRLPDERFLLQDDAVSTMDSGMMAKSVASANAIKLTKGYQTEKSRDLLTTAEALADFGEYLKQTNSERAKANERRRRELSERGVA